MRPFPLLRLPDLNDSMTRRPWREKGHESTERRNINRKEGNILSSEIIQPFRKSPPPPPPCVSSYLTPLCKGCKISAFICILDFFSKCYTYFSRQKIIERAMKREDTIQTKLRGDPCRFWPNQPALFWPSLCACMPARAWLGLES